MDTFNINFSQILKNNIFQKTLICMGSVGVLKMYIYSVMQSDGSSFCGKVASDSSNKTYQNKDNILEQIYKRKYVKKLENILLFC